MNTEKLINFLLLGLLIALVILFEFFPKAYREGVLDTQKEAFEKGYTIKEINKDDKVIYKWK